MVIIPYADALNNNNNNLKKKKENPPSNLFLVVHICQGVSKMLQWPLSRVAYPFLAPNRADTCLKYPTASGASVLGLVNTFCF